LSIEIWDFSTVSGKSNCFYLNQLALALTFPEKTGFSRCISVLQALKYAVWSTTILPNDR